MTVGEALRGGEAGVGCWEQLRNEPRTSANILCALELALEPPQPIHHCGILSDPGPLPGARGRLEGGGGEDCQHGGDTTAGSSAGLLSV